MKRFGIMATLGLIVVALLGTDAAVYAQNLLWAKRAGGSGSMKAGVLRWIVPATAM